MTEKDVATALATTMTALLVALKKQGVIDGEQAFTDTVNLIDDVRREAADDGPADRILAELTARLLTMEGGD